MARRRNNHEGTINQLPSGKWRAQIYLDGKRRGYTAETRQACSKWLRQIQNEPPSDNPQGERGKTFGAYLEEWLLSRKSSLRTTTWSHYRQLATARIIPALGSIALRDLRPGQIQSIYDAMLKAGLGPRTIQVVHVVIHECLSQAVKLELLDRNPDDATSPPKVAHHEMKFYDESQVTQFLIAAKSDRNEALYYMALYTGMRQAELLALRWSDVDWSRKTIRVQRQLRRDFRDGDYFISPKTTAGIRTILLGSNGIAKLREHLERQNHERAFVGGRWKEYDLIFPSSVGTPMDHSNLYKSFKQLIRKAGLPEIRFHDLRHSSASLLLNNGIPPTIVARRLGHSRVSITLDTYSHTLPEMQGEAAELMDELITPISIELHTIAHDLTATPSNPLESP